MSRVKIVFLNNGNSEIIEEQRYNIMNDIFKRYAKIIGKKMNEIFFLYNGQLINNNKTLGSTINQENINEIQILVYEYEENGIEDIVKASKDIICPICKELCFINFKEYKINFISCKNNHFFSNILFNEFKDFQKINESKIICNSINCKNNKGESMNNLFYKCYNCNINLCPLCKSNHVKKHDKTHIVKDYDLKNYFCNEHDERFILYCKDCNKHICDICDYNKHILFQHNCFFLYKKKIKVSNSMNDLKGKINILKNDMSNSNKQLNKIIENFELF